MVYKYFISYYFDVSPQGFAFGNVVVDCLELNDPERIRNLETYIKEAVKKDNPTLTTLIIQNFIKL